MRRALELSGQAQGGLVQGVGFALNEYLPLMEGGPGNGDWNLDRYRVPRAPDQPLWNLEIEVLPPLGPTDVPKGMRTAQRGPTAISATVPAMSGITRRSAP